MTRRLRARRASAPAVLADDREDAIVTTDSWTVAEAKAKFSELVDRAMRRCACSGAHEAEIRAQGVTRLAVFGSMARNEARPDSDVDLSVDRHHRQRRG